MATPLDNLLAFTAFTHDVRNVKRAMWVKGEEQYENDSEHSFQIALVALYLIEQDKLALDLYRVMSMALVHDILEVHSGDTFIYGQDTGTKGEREARAIKTLREQWPEQKTMHTLIDEYESKASPEAKFVYALDKLVPILNNMLDNGRNWRHDNITLDQLIKIKSDKISIDPEVQKYYELALELLRKKPELFAAA